MAEKYLMGVDLGTSTCKSALFSVAGQVLAVSRGEYAIESPQRGWAEHDQAVWWSEVARTIRENLVKASVAPSEVVGVGCCAMSRAPTPISREGRVLRKAIINMDRRTGKQERWMKATMKFSSERHRQTPVPTSVKLLWLKEHEPDVLRGAYKVVMPKSFLVWKLTGQFAEEPLDASMTGLFDSVTNDWSDELLSAYGVPREQLAEIRKPWDVVGGVTEQAAKDTGLAVGTPVVVGAHDNECLNLGSGLVKAGRLLDKTGTVGRLTLAVERPADAFGFSLVPTIGLVGIAMETGAASLRWVRNQLCEPERLVAGKAGAEAYQLMDQEAACVEPGAGGILFTPHLIGRSGTTNRHGVIFGLTLQATREQLVRAVMEGYSYELRRGKERVIDPQGGSLGEVWATGGGAKSRVWRQIKADVLGLPYCQLNIEETGCLGAAIIAGYGVGVFSDLVSPIDTFVKVVERNEPRPEYQQRYDALYQVYKKLNETLEQSKIFDDYVKTLETVGIYPPA